MKPTKEDVTDALRDLVAALPWRDQCQGDPPNDAYESCQNAATWSREKPQGHAQWDSCDDCIAGFMSQDARAVSKGSRARDPWIERHDAEAIRALEKARRAAEELLQRLPVRLSADRKRREREAGTR